MIYIDGSALVKLIFDEPESDALVRWLADRETVPKISSELSTIELLRTCRRRKQAAVPLAQNLLTGVNLIPISRDLAEQAGLVGPPDLRSLDAIHLASAMLVQKELSAFVAYDGKLRSAAGDAGFQVTAPR